MKKEKHIASYTSDELKALRAESRTDLKRVDAMTDEELERLIAEDADERDLRPDWTKARLVMPEPKQSVHLRLEQEVVEFFKAQGKGHITKMQAVLKAYVNAHRPHAKH
ncbi:MAG: BrnA antitoxin family protein [Nitrospirae bacterium]|nr:BrnA antitoxin family protein [Nitrospirota bacterium]